jgi:hypothetical protein
MARYSAFLGRKVEVQYRAGDIVLPASGTFVADSGRSIFLEQSFVQKGQQRNFRWEIPYQYIVRLEEKQEEPEEPAGTMAEASVAKSAVEPVKSAPKPAVQASESSMNTTGGASGLLPFQNRPKTA